MSVVEQSDSFHGSNSHFKYRHDIEIYRVDSMSIDKEGYLTYALSFFRSRSKEEGWQSTQGTKGNNLQDASYVFGDKMQRDKFMETFLIIEVLTISNLALRFSNSVEDYRLLYDVFSDIELNKRFKRCFSIWDSSEALKKPRHYRDLLNLRNQLSHTFESSKLRYGNSSVWVDKQFSSRIAKDLSESIAYLLKTMQSQDDKVLKLQEELRSEQD